MLHCSEFVFALFLNILLFLSSTSSFPFYGLLTSLLFSSLSFHTFYSFLYLVFLPHFLLFSFSAIHFSFPPSIHFTKVEETSALMSSRADEVFESLLGVNVSLTTWIVFCSLRIRICKSASWKGRSVVERKKGIDWDHGGDVGWLWLRKQRTMLMAIR